MITHVRTTYTSANDIYVEGRQQYWQGA
jgi:hypothetical protein